MSDVEMIIIGLVTHSLACAREAVKQNQFKFARIYISVADNWLHDLKLMKEENLL